MRYLITFSYDGSKYQGYQKQPSMNTIQDEIEKVLFKLAHEKCVSIHASGRTDAGVHAFNQKAHFDLDENINLDKLKHSINSMLPNDIYVKKVELVKDEFHARFYVKRKEYIYKINIGEYNPIEKNYVYQLNRSLNINNIKEALLYLKGTHDFKSFTKSNNEKEDYIRTIFKADMMLENNQIIFSFIGTGFLRYQIRNMVGTLLEIGLEVRKPKDIKEILEAKDRRCAGKIAPSCGLYLKDVYYE